MTGPIQINPETLSWLLTPETPGARYLALRDLVELPETDRELEDARQAAYERGPIATILAAMEPDGYWAAPGPGYNPKYRSSVWALIMLGQLGASSRHDKRLATACAYMLDASLTANGQFTASGTPSTTVDCLQGNLCTAMLALEYDDPRLEQAFEWMARSLTGEGVAPNTDRQAELRYYAGKCGPRFACGANNKLPCAWGGVKVMLAFSLLPEARRTPLIEAAIQEGVDFLFSTDPALADYPSGYAPKPSGNWWKFGFPVFYVTDLLQNVEALVRLGYAQDHRLAQALALIREKQDAHGRWALEYEYGGKTWVDFGAKKAPSKWVTLRALNVLKMAGNEKLPLAG